MSRDHIDQFKVMAWNASNGFSDPFQRDSQSIPAVVEKSSSVIRDDSTANAIFLFNTHRLIMKDGLVVDGPTRFLGCDDEDAERLVHKDAAQLKLQLGYEHLAVTEYDDSRFFEETDDNLRRYMIAFTKEKHIKPRVGRLVGRNCLQIDFSFGDNNELTRVIGIDLDDLEDEQILAEVNQAARIIGDNGMAIGTFGVAYNHPVMRELRHNKWSMPTDGKSVISRAVQVNHSFEHAIYTPQTLESSPFRTSKIDGSKRKAIFVDIAPND